MAPDERDRIFDQALARHLRSACPDPETLAAYHERSLLPEQLNSLKEHIVGCANCQTVLAHLELTDEIPMQAAQEEQVLAAKESAPVIAARNLESVPAGSPKKSRRVLLLRGARWQWLAPAGAIAAGLLVWIALHENQRLTLKTLPQNENKVAENRVPAAPVPPVSSAEPKLSASSKPAPALTRPQSPAGEPAISNGRAGIVAPRQSPTSSDKAGTRSDKSASDDEFSAQKDRERDISADQLTAANRADLDAKNVPEALRKKEEAPSPAANVQAETAQLQNSQTQNQSNNYPAQKVPGPAPLNQTESSKKLKSTAAAAPATPPPPSGVAGGVASSYNDTASLRVARLMSNSRLISPPGSNTFWRVGRSGLIEFSKDGGSSWSRQTSGVLADLQTGSAPSDQVCWVVGRVGSILLTTDGGAHWKIVPSPTTEDLGGVRASDALHATIWNARGTKSFETADGGLTWKPVTNP